MKLIISGICGRMGKALLEVIEETSHEVICGYDVDSNENAIPPVFSNIEKLAAEVDCAIDFTLPEGLMEIAEFCKNEHIPLVSGTTGLSDEQFDYLKSISSIIPVFYATNMSLMVGFLKDCAAQAAMLFPDADIEVIEYHHRNKVDAPSGTAMTIVSKMLDARKQNTDSLVFGRNGKIGQRPANQIAIHAIRAGGIVGEHHVLFALPEEEIMLVHRARDRKLFARGAIKAAKWLAKKEPGMYNIQNILDSNE